MIRVGTIRRRISGTSILRSHRGGPPRRPYPRPKRDRTTFLYSPQASPNSHLRIKPGIDAAFIVANTLFTHVIHDLQSPGTITQPSSPQVFYPSHLFYLQHINRSPLRLPSRLFRPLEVPFPLLLPVKAIVNVDKCGVASAIEQTVGKMRMATYQGRCVGGCGDPREANASRSDCNYASFEPLLRVLQT